MRDYQIGEWVIFTDKKERCCYHSGKKPISLYRKIGKIIKVKPHNYLVEFTIFINGHDGNDGQNEGKGKFGHCWFCLDEDFELAIDSLKFKKWTKG